MVTDRRNILSISFTTFNILTELFLRFVRPNVKMFPEPHFLLPATPWIIVSVPLGTADQIFSYCTFS